MNVKEPVSTDLDISSAKIVVRAIYKVNRNKIDLINVNIHKNQSIYLFSATYNVERVDNEGNIQLLEMIEKSYKKKTMKEIVRFIEKLSNNEKLMGLEINELFLKEVNKVVNGLAPSIKFNNSMVAEALKIDWSLFKEL